MAGKIVYYAADIETTGLLPGATTLSSWPPSGLRMESPPTPSAPSFMRAFP